jgi:hypothetical protein
VFDKVDGEITARLENGDSVPGYALQPGRGSNVWNDSEENIAKMLKGRRLKKEQIYPPKLISPAQVMKLDCLDDKQKARIEKDFITYKAGKTKLTKVARDKQQDSIEDMFKDIPQESVAQSTTNKVESTSLFDQPNEPSFF